MCGCMQHIQLHLATHLDPGTEVYYMVIQPAFGSSPSSIFFLHDMSSYSVSTYREYVRKEYGHMRVGAYIANDLREREKRLYPAWYTPTVSYARYLVNAASYRALSLSRDPPPFIYVYRTFPSLLSL